ncbi:MAG TPA: NifU family protein, partial [Blastocatellia bacterium]|nr:NifU family protein [Blastocatellia bacterium]
MQDTHEFQERIGRVDGLIQQLQSAADPALRAAARELVQSMVDLQGAGMERILEIVSQSGEAGDSIVRSFAGDPIVSSLLILHDLHPDSFETRVQHAVDKVRPLLTKRSS